MTIYIHDNFTENENLAVNLLITQRKHKKKGTTQINLLRPISVCVP